MHDKAGIKRLMTSDRRLATGKHALTHSFLQTSPDQD